MDDAALRTIFERFPFVETPNESDIESGLACPVSVELQPRNPRLKRTKEQGQITAVRVQAPSSRKLSR